MSEPSSPAQEDNPSNTIRHTRQSRRVIESKQKSTSDAPVKRKRPMEGPTKRMKTVARDLTLCCWNVNGLRAVIRKEALHAFLAIKQPDILFLSETLIQPCHIQDLEAQLPSYYYKYWATSQKKGYAGVCLLSKQEPVSVSIGTGIEKHDQEGRLITAEYPQYYIVGMYAPHLANDTRLAYRFNEWDIDLMKHVKDLQTRKPVIWLGDFNVIHDSYDFHSSSKETWPHTTAQEHKYFREMLADLQMIDSFRHLNPDSAVYSYFDRRHNAKALNKGWRIDFILVPSAFTDCLREAYIMTDIEGSDHVPVMATLSII